MTSRRSVIALAFGSVASIASFGCKSGGAVPEGAHASPGHAWSYVGDTGPASWASLHPTCGGARQSPIDLVTKDEVPSRTPGDLAFTYAPFVPSAFHNGHTVEMRAKDGPSVSLHGTTSQLANVHFHTPSEHTVDGKHFAAEMHMVHKDASGAVTVVAFFVNEGAENPSLAPLFRSFPTEPTKEPIPLSGPVDLAPLVAKVRSFATYPGSLTVPPCTENVTWIVVPEPIEMSSAQLAPIKAATHGDSARPTQPRNDRVVTNVTGK